MITPRSPATRDCVVVLEELDRLADLTGTRDAGEYRLPGHPYLRTDRFTASLRDRLARSEDGTSDPAFDAWLERMRQIDAEARAGELANLPADAYPVLRRYDREETLAAVESCGRLLLDEQRAEPMTRRRLQEAAEVPDEYRTGLRALGVYPVSGIAIAQSVRSWQDEQRALFAQSRGSGGNAGGNAGGGNAGGSNAGGNAGGANAGGRERSVPANAPLSTEAALEDARAVLRAAPRDALGIPRIDGDPLDRLFHAFAPSFQIGVRADSDRIGSLQWIDLKGILKTELDPWWLTVDTTAPVVYRRLAFTRFGDAVLPQLIYTIWFSEQPLEDVGDLHGGRLDGLVWRVTLDETGVPLLYDSIEPSGRFALFFPTERLRTKPVPTEDPLVEWAFSPIDRSLERWLGTERVAGVSLIVASGSHRLVGVERPDPVARGPGDRVYRWVDADRMRALTRPGGGSRSVFDDGGTIPGSERFARFVLWPSGIPNVGAMRQWGRQPTALVGRRHFDDPDLLSRRWDRVPPQAPAATP